MEISSSGIKADGARPKPLEPELRSPGSEASWCRHGVDEWRASYNGRELSIVRGPRRSPLLIGYADGNRLFRGVRFLPVAQQRCEAMVRLKLVGTHSPRKRQASKA
jgi:hypothetical protein